MDEDKSFANEMFKLIWYFDYTNDFVKLFIHSMRKWDGRD